MSDILTMFEGLEDVVPLDLQEALMADHLSATQDRVSGPHINQNVRPQLGQHLAVPPRSYLLQEAVAETTMRMVFIRRHGVHLLDFIDDQHVGSVFRAVKAGRNVPTMITPEQVFRAALILAQLSASYMSAAFKEDPDMKPLFATADIVTKLEFDDAKQTPATTVSTGLRYAKQLTRIARNLPRQAPSSEIYLDGVAGLCRFVAHEAIAEFRSASRPRPRATSALDAHER